MVNYTRDQILKNIESGEFKIASKRVEISSGATENFYIGSPSGTSKRVDVIGVRTPTGADLSVDISNDFDIDGKGSDMNVMNSKTSENDSTGLDFKYGGSFSNVTVGLEDFLPGGSQGSTAGTDDDHPTRLVVTEGDGVLLQLTNDSNAAEKTSVIVEFVERDSR